MATINSSNNRSPSQPNDSQDSDIKPWDDAMSECCLTTTESTDEGSTCNGDTSIHVVPDDNAEYLRRELFGRVQHEPELFEWIQKAALDGMWYWDLENPEQEWLSPEFKATFGYTDDEIPNKSMWWQENIFPQDKEKAIALFNRHVNDGVPYDSIVRYKHKDGSTIWVRCRGKASFNEQGIPVRMLGAHNDVTQLMKVQEELKKKEAVLDLLCTTALDGFWDWNKETGENFLSSRWKRALGYEEEDIKNTVEGWKALLHPDDFPKAMEALRKHMEEGAPYSVVLRYKRKDGSIAHMLSQGVAQKDDHGEWVRMFGTHTDVSYLEEARAARQASEAKTTFLATMSHEIRTPLNAILGMAQVLQGTQLTEEQLDCVNTLSNSGKHLLALINDILDFSQIEAGLVAINTTQMNIQETVREVVHVMQLSAKNKGIAVKFDTSIPPGARFLSDPERTRQIVFNLMGNAVKFTAEGTVNVSLSMEEREGLSGALISVKDTGCGMKQEHLTRIFDDFTQASKEVRHQYGGSGLGLSISKKLVNVMGGTIGVESLLGVGSTFTVWLPGFIPGTMKRAPLTPSGSGKVFLYEELCAVQSRDEEYGSVAKAICATGRTVVRILDPFHLDKELPKQGPEPRTIVCALKDGGSRCNDIVQRLLQLQPNALVDVGRRIDPSLLPSKVTLQTLQSFPTTDEMQQAFQHHQSPCDNSPHLNGLALGKIGRDLRILLAEDIPTNVKVMKKLLSRFPCRVEVAWNGEEAVEKARGGTWDLILMDMVMPVMDGLDATKAIREFDGETYIVALTANATVQDKGNCLEAGMNKFLSKPVSLVALSELVAQIATAVAAAESSSGSRQCTEEDIGFHETLEAVGRLCITPSA